MKITTIDMDWTDGGARILASMEIRCPVCQTLVTPNVEHLCGNRAPKPKKPARGKSLVGLTIPERSA